MPAAGMLILDYFARISQGRSYTNDGTQLPLTYQDINSWCQLTDTVLSDYELNAIKQLDITSINSSYKERKRSKG